MIKLLKNKYAQAFDGNIFQSGLARMPKSLDQRLSLIEARTELCLPLYIEYSLVLTSFSAQYILQQHKYMA